MRSWAPFPYEIVAVNLDQKQPGFPEHVLPDYLDKYWGVPFILKHTIPILLLNASFQKERGHVPCVHACIEESSIGIADRLGATKIALGHHRDDIAETLILNLFFGGNLRAMPPKLVSEDGRLIVIRPLVYVKESDLACYSDLRCFPIIPCDLCGSQENLKRKEVKVLPQQWNRQFPGCTDSIAASLSNVLPEHLLDRKLFDFTSLMPVMSVDKIN